MLHLDVEIFLFGPLDALIGAWARILLRWQDVLNLDRRLEKLSVSFGCDEIDLRLVHLDCFLGRVVKGWSHRVLAHARVSIL